MNNAKNPKINSRWIAEAILQRLESASGINAVTGNPHATRLDNALTIERIDQIIDRLTSPEERNAALLMSELDALTTSYMQALEKACANYMNF